MTQDVSKSLRSTLAQVRGLGSAHTGLHHWKAQRVTALALLPLGLWFIGWIAPLLLEPPQTLHHLLKMPIHSVGMILFIISSFYHGVLGVQIIIEDYMHHTFTKFFFLLTLKGLACILSSAGLFFVLILHLQA